MTRRRALAELGAATATAAAALAIIAAPASASARSASATTTQTGSTLQPPSLTSATLVADTTACRTGGSYVKLLWTPSPSAGVADYAVFADGKFLFEGAPYDNAWGLNPQLADVCLNERGLTGSETFTVAAVDSRGDESASSNGLAAVAPKALPAPTLTSAVIKNGLLALAWTPSHTTESSGNILYLVRVDNGLTAPGGFVTSVLDATAVTTGVSFGNPTDPTVPVVNVTTSSKISIEAEDLTTATSPLSNVLAPTSG